MDTDKQTDRRFMTAVIAAQLANYYTIDQLSGEVDYTEVRIRKIVYAARNIVEEIYNQEK